MLEIDANRRTGSLLVNFEEQNFDREAFNSMLKETLSTTGKSSKKSRSKTTTMGVVKRGMLASLGLSLVAAIVDEESPHIALGTFFLGLLSYHLG